MIKNEILKPVKNNKKSFIHIKPLFTHIDKYNSEIFHLIKQNLIRNKLTNILVETSTS